MKGLIRNHFYSIKDGMKWLAVIFLFTGIPAATVLEESYLLILACILVMDAPAIYYLSVLCRESQTGFRKYILSSPVTRKEIIKSNYMTQLLLLIAGVLTAGLLIALSVLVRGFAFDMMTDAYGVFGLGLCMNFILGAVFYPLYYLEKNEKKELLLGLSIVLSLVIPGILIWFMDSVLYPALKLNANDFSVYLVYLVSMAYLVLAGLLAIVLSFPVTVKIFHKRSL